MKVYLDTETYGEIPIKHGTHAYAEGVEIMLWTWAVDDGPVQHYDATTGEPMPDDLAYLLGTADRYEWVIHNAQFDFTVLRHSGWALPVHCIHDTMVQALCHALPGSLEKLCDILKVPQDAAKIKDGKRLINLFCKPMPKKSKIRRATRITHPEDWARFIEYACNDISAMREVYKRLPTWNYSLKRDWQRELYELDFAVNQRGFAIDTDLMHAAIRATEAEQAKLREEVRDATGGYVTSASRRDQFIDHILIAHGIEMADLKKDTLERALDNDDFPPEVKALIRIRLQASSSSSAKYKALRNAISPDGIMRGTLQFRGAMRTGRWGGRIFQPHNLTRPTYKAKGFKKKHMAIEAAIEALKGGYGELMTDNVMELISSCLRGLIVPRKGKRFAIADLSNIEGRVLAWLAGDENKLQRFREADAGTGPDIYAATSGDVFGVPPEQVTAEKEAGDDMKRQVGKCCELGLGFGGGAFAFIAMAMVYRLDLEAIAKSAQVPREWLDLARGYLAKRKQEGESMRGLSDDVFVVCDAFKRAWRDAHPEIVRFWHDLENAVRDAILCPGQVFKAGPHLHVVKSCKWLRIRLPSGRCLVYPGAHIDDKDEICFYGINQYTRKWSLQRTYSGKLAENVTQAMAADVLGWNQLKLEQAGYDLVLHVHDENICETETGSGDDLAGIMATPPEWAPDLPLSAEGFDAMRYRK